MNLHHVVNSVTAFLMGAILMALVFVFVTRTGDWSKNSSPPTAAVVHGGQPATGLDAAEVERVAEKAATRAVEAERKSKRDRVRGDCRTGELPYGLCMELGIPPRAEICKDSRTSAAERAELRCHEFSR